MNIKLERLKQLVSYDPHSGLFVWRVNKRGRFARHGTLAGSKDSRGYIRLTLDQKFHYAHRLAWFYMTGDFPSCIDHINANKSDNRICNLRIATSAENQQNRTQSSRNNKSGLLGVSPFGDKWRATIYLNNKQIYLGLYLTKDQAKDAYLKAKRKFHPYAWLSKTS